MYCSQMAAAGAFILLLASPVVADYRHEFDLAKHPLGEVTLPVAPGAISIVVTNRIPGHQYFYAVAREWVPIPLLTIPTEFAIPFGAALDTNCAAVMEEYQKIGVPTDETNVPAKSKAIAGLMKSPAFENCSDAKVRKPIEDAALSLTSAEILGPISIGAGEQLRVTVQRIAPAGTVERMWSSVLTTGARGEWLTTYGLSFVRNDSQRFFMTPASEQGKFVVTRERDIESREVTFVPSILFSWVPTRQRDRYVVVSPTAGFGATSNTFAALIGATATFNLNLGVTAGIAITNHQRLAGKYAEGQVVSESLNDSQLHRQAKIPTFFLSTTFRFGRSPFATEPRPSTPAPAAPPPSAASTPASPTPPAKPATGEAPVGGAPAAGDKTTPKAVPTPTPPGA
jgi:hypothetical protein